MFMEFRRPKVAFNEGATLGLPYVLVGIEGPGSKVNKRLLAKATALVPSARKKFKRKVRLYRRQTTSGQFIVYLRPMPIDGQDELLKEF